MNILKRKESILFLLFVVLIPAIIASQSFAETLQTNSEAQVKRIIYNESFTLDLSNDEKSWLNDNSTIRLGIDRAFPPFGSITKDHEYIGFSADIMRIVEHRLGITFDVAKDAPWNETMKMAKAGEIDMISALVNSKQRQQFLTFTSPYISNPTIIINDGEVNGYIGSLKNLKGKKVAIEAGSYSAGVLAREYPKIELIPVDNTSMALSLVSIGKADAYVGNGVTSSYLIRKLGYHNLSYAGQTEYQSSHSIGVTKENNILADIMKKAISSVSKSDIEAIANYWFGVRTNSFISKSTALSIGSVLGGLVVFFSFWVFSLRKTRNELKKSQQAIKSHSEIDYLTGLGNRRKFYQTLNSKITQCDNQGNPFTLFFLDLDRFKEVNDSLGHAVGDLLLVEASQRILASIGEAGLVSRIGGDEFMVILPELTNNKEIEQYADCIRRRLNDPFTIEGNEINITTSIGITCYPNDANDAEQLVINGDQAMYASKKKGRNCYTYFNKKMTEEAQYKACLCRNLRTAISEKQFTLHYQPIVDLATNRINKAEALIRWDHPERGLVSPAEFIPLAEEAGLINEIGEWTFKKAIDHTADIQKRFNMHFQMTINTSPLQYRSNGLDIASWYKYMSSQGLTGDNLIVEITEGVLMEASETVKNTLFQLRDRKVGVAIDDFGTGYSSLAYLKKFDIDYLKIDRTFVKNLSVGSDDAVLIQAIIMMAHQLGLKVVAEGIETAAQRDILIEAGCDFGQGYYYSKPIEAAAFIDLLENWDNNVSTESLDCLAND